MKANILSRGAWLAVPALSLMALACALVMEKEEFPYATIAPSCAPWDGPATELRLSANPLKCGQGDVIELSIYFWRDLPLHDNQTFSLDAKSNWGGASYCKGGQQPCERATSGSVHIESISPDKGARGTYDLAFPKHGRVSGSFQASWCKMRVVCG
jgi:hypothetical protein